MKVSAAVTIVLTIEIPTVGNYGADWKLCDLHKQAVREAEEAVRHKFPQVRFIGTPKIKASVFEAE